MAWEPRIKTCRRSLPSLRKRRMPVRKPGVPIFCRAVIKARTLCRGQRRLPNVSRRVAAAELQQLELEQLARINRRHAERHDFDAALEARIKSFETAFGMQREAPEAFDLSKETDATLQLYGLQRRQHGGLRLAMSRGPAIGRTRRAIHRTDRHRFLRQLGFARQHARPCRLGEECRSSYGRARHRSQTTRHAR